MEEILCLVVFLQAGPRRGYGLTSIQHILTRWNAFVVIEEEVNGAHISLNIPILKRQWAFYSEC